MMPDGKPVSILKRESKFPAPKPKSASFNFGGFGGFSRVPENSGLQSMKGAEIPSVFLDV